MCKNRFPTHRYSHFVLSVLSFTAFCPKPRTRKKMFFLDFFATRALGHHVLSVVSQKPSGALRGKFKWPCVQHINQLINTFVWLPVCRDICRLSVDIFTRHVDNQKCVSMRPLCIVQGSHGPGKPGISSSPPPAVFKLKSPKMYPWILLKYTGKLLEFFFSGQGVGTLIVLCSLAGDLLLIILLYSYILQNSIYW